MEPDTQPIQPEDSQPVQQVHPEKPQLPLSKVLIILLGVLILLFVLGGAYILGANHSSTTPDTSYKTVAPSSTVGEVTPTTPSQAISPTIAPSSKLQAYSGSGYSVQFPKEWIGKSGYNFSGDYMMYDSTSLQTTQGNGGSVVSFPSKFVDILSVVSSSETPTAYANRVTSADPAYSGNAQIRTLTINNMPAAIYQQSGAGSTGYNVVVSNGKKLVVVNVSAENPTSDTLVNQILSSFTFTQ